MSGACETSAEKATKTVEIVRQYWRPANFGRLLYSVQPQLGRSIFDAWMAGDFDGPLLVMRRLDDGAYL